MPPSVTLLNYISSGILWRICSQTGIFAGFSLHFINLAVRFSAAVVAGDIIQYFLRVPKSAGPSLGPEGKHFVSKNSLFFYFGGSSGDGWGARSALLGAGMSPKRRGRARAAKTH